jgi:hypothetical protein
MIAMLPWLKMRDAIQAFPKKMSRLPAVVHAESEGRFPPALLFKKTLPEDTQGRELQTLAGQAGKLGSLARRGQCAARSGMAERTPPLLATQTEVKTIALQIQIGSTAGGR